MIRLFEFSDIRTFGSAIKLFSMQAADIWVSRTSAGSTQALSAATRGRSPPQLSERIVVDGRNGRFGERIDEVSVLRILPAVDGPGLDLFGGPWGRIVGGAVSADGRVRALSGLQFGDGRAAQVGDRQEQDGPFHVRASVTTLLRLRLYLSAQTDASIREAYIKQVILTGSDLDSNLTGGCFLSFVDGTLTSTETAGTRTQITVTLPAPVKITREKDRCGYVDFVMLSTAAGSGRLSFDARLQDNTKLTVAAKDAPKRDSRPERVTSSTVR